MQPGPGRRVPSQAEVAAMLDMGDLAFSRGPLPAVLDTDFIRTGLQDQLRQGKLPMSVWSSQEGSLRVLMEYETLAETERKLPKFSDQLGVPVSELRRILNQEWLPNIEVVRLPSRFREVDPRAVLVRDGDGVRKGDPDDFPAAALASLLSPCLLLTHNHRHFGALGVRTREQGLEGVTAIVAIKIGEVRLRAVLWLPSMPLQLAGTAMKLATDRMGPWPWIILGVVVVGGVYWYVQQPPERRARTSAKAAEIGTAVFGPYTRAAEEVYQARLQLRASLVPKPEQRTPVSAILRELAISRDSLSAAQLAELLDTSVRPPVAKIRAFLRAHDGEVFRQVRRGGFALGSHHRLRD